MKRDNLYEYIKGFKSGITKNDELIRQYILDHYDQEFDIADIAAGTFISNASVSRFVKKIKYKSFKALLKDKKFIGDNFNPKNEDYEQLYKKMCEDKTKVIESTLALNSSQSIIEFSRKIAKHKTLYIYGLGHSAYEANSIKVRLARIGLRVILLTSRHEMILEGITQNDDDASFLFITQTGETKELIDMSRLIIKQKLEILCITNDPKSTIACLSSQVLLTEKIYSGFLIESLYSEASVGFVLDQIYATILNFNYKDNLEKYNETKKYISKNN